MYGRILLPLDGSEVAEAVELDFRLAFVGNLGSGEVKDFTAIGDVVNTAARLQSAEMPGQVVMSERVYQRLGTATPSLHPACLEPFLP